MGVLPCQFPEGANARTLRIDGSESFDLTGLETGVRPRGEVRLTIRRADGSSEEVALRTRIDTPIEVDYYRHGGILPFVLRQLVA
jgi:aconitate hydratase